ncbi:PaaX family transcriptional regulator [Saccharothrix hoggarensis]|uniref:PaaX family transcriptional regulator C-terminal domain-containing protein n=1 Tax=Saccharothrix hoggarensis TaxID=913853 RepID=A0ABW3QLJ1_9PSEU
MTSPYDIDEIFPGDDVRLPRRQHGNSPQGLTVTLMADYTLRTRAWLPSAAIVALLAEAGVSQAGARATISRLARRGVLEGSKRGRHSSYRLTAAAAHNLAAGGRAIASAATTAWDGHWTLVAFSLPQEDVTRRRELRGLLRWLGYAPLYDGLWISPRELTDKLGAHLVDVGGVTVFRARHVDVGATGRAPLDAWDTTAITHDYEEFIRRWNAVLPDIRCSRITGPEAVRARTEVMDTYRRLPILDPGLPLDLLPPGWPREPARDVFNAVYDGLAAPAQEHVRAVASRFTTDPLPDVRAHTVADLLAGVVDVPEPVAGRGR